MKSLAKTEFEAPYILLAAGFDLLESALSMISS
jgi:hypothetical protein